MGKKKYFFAVDLGATSGRTIIGNIQDGKTSLEEVTRFRNNLIEQGGHFYWDVYALYFEIIRGLKEVASRGLEIMSIGIDTWGVDFVFIGEDNAILRNPRAYRDPITFDAMDDYLKNVISRREIYDMTGIQLMNFNSVFQLYAMKREGNSALKNAKRILFVPEPFHDYICKKKQKLKQNELSAILILFYKTLVQLIMIQIYKKLLLL